MDIEQQELKPVFGFSDNSSDILIHRGKAEICLGENTHEGEGEVRLGLLPRAGICFYSYFKELPNEAISFVFGENKISSFSFNGRQIEGFLLSSGGDFEAHEINCKWCPNKEPITGLGDDSTQMNKIVFHLYNFIDFFGGRFSTEEHDKTLHRINHVDLICDEWKIHLKSLISTSDKIELLRKEGGYQLTHVGGLEKIDSTTFSGEQANECLKAIRYFLSFTKGCWCEPICAVGFDASGNHVWESWASPNESWHEPLSWFDSHNALQLSELFKLFMIRWNNEGWCNALREIIYWYQNANHSSRGIEAGIILTQAAIERLSYEYSVNDKGLLSGKGFKDLRASDKFRLLFSSLKIPLSIPDETTIMKKLAEENNWLDAPHALPEIRNSLVHPEHKKRGQLNTAHHEAWNLGLWYLEMGVLAICGYQGTYGNRLKQRWKGQVENVPWNSK
jgi:hypothetical protein